MPKPNHPCKLFWPALAIVLLLAASPLTSACTPLLDAVNEVLPTLVESLAQTEVAQVTLDALSSPTVQTSSDQPDATRTPGTNKKASATPRASTPTDATAANTPTPAKKKTAAPSPTSSLSFGDFDYFVLSLSWAPEFCSANNDPQECAIGRKLGFVLHGLWPQYKVGYPSSCTTEKLPADVRAEFTDIFPNDKLISHEWEKHGTCSGLSPRDYLHLSKQIKESVVIPAAYKKPAEPFRVTVAELKSAFVQANPSLSEGSLELACSGSGRYLSELYVCFAKDGSPTSCGSDVHKTALKSCAQKDFLVRNTR
jgi:ribonuclease T2